MEAKIDLEDLERVKEEELSWYSKYFPNNDSYYAMATKYRGTQPDGKSNNTTVQLHRLIMNYYGKDDVDHHNHDTLDDTKNNLFVVDKNKNSKNRKSKNSNNKSGYRNVCWDKKTNKWMVQLQVNGKNTVLGRFDDVHEAGKFAEEKRKELYGEYAGTS